MGDAVSFVPRNQVVLWWKRCPTRWYQDLHEDKDDVVFLSTSQICLHLTEQPSVKTWKCLFKSMERGAWSWSSVWRHLFRQSLKTGGFSCSVALKWLHSESKRPDTIAAFFCGCTSKWSVCYQQLSGPLVCVARRWPLTLSGGSSDASVCGTKASNGEAAGNSPRLYSQSWRTMSTFPFAF